MGTGFVMAIDAGGGGVRCMLVDVDSGAMTLASRVLRHPVAPGTEGWGYDLDTDGIWLGLGQATREALSRAGAKPEQVLGVAATSMRHGMVLLDGDGKVVWAVPNRDARAAGQGMEIAGARGPEFNARTGHWPTPIAVAARLSWLKETNPASLARTRTYLAISEWIAHRLCGRAAAEPSHAAETSLFDLASGAWALDLIDGLGLPKGIFPPVKRAGDALGPLSPAAAESLGLKAGTPVAVGGADTQCALLALGATGPGRVGVVAGTTIPVQLVTDKPVIDGEARLWTGCHVVPRRFVLESNAGAAGEALDWLGDLLFPGDRAAAARLAAEAALSVPGAGGFLSSLGAQIFHASRLGLPVATLAFSHLSASAIGSSRRHLARAVLEGLAFSTRANLDQVKAVGGAGTGPLALAGGLSRGTLWPRLLADVTGRPVEVGATADATLLGAAICAGAGAKVWPDLEAGAKRLAKTRARHEPDPSLKVRYEGLYDDWQRWRSAREEADGIAAEAALRGAGENAAPARAAKPASAGFRPRILVTTPFDEASLARLRALGAVEYCTYIERQRVLTGDDLVETLQGFHVLVTEVDIIDAASIERMPDLRVVFSCRSNPVNVDVPACTAFGVPVLNTPGRNAIAVAEMTLAMLLSLVRRIPMADQFMRQPGAEAGDMARMGIAHETYRGTELHGKTVGLIGFGRIGRMVGALLRPYGVRLLAFDPVVPPDAILRDGAEPAGLDELLAVSDIVSLHAAVTSDTRGLLGATELARMKKGALIVNSARAALVDEDALAEAIQRGHLGGAALDVWRQEPPASDHPLLGLPDVVATPHVAGNTHEVAGHQGASVADSIEKLLRGDVPDTLLNPETLVGFGWTGERRKPTAAELEGLAKGGGPAITDLEAAEQEEEAQAAPPAGSPDVAPVAVQEPAVEAPRKGLFGKIGSLFGGGGKPAAEAPTPVATPVAAAAPAGGSGRVDEARRKLDAILRDFMARTAADPVIRDFAKGKNVTVRYFLPDVDLAFHMAFAGDVPSCAMGDPPHKPHLTLKMDAVVLDDVMMERIGGMKAAMSGLMAFSGNTMKAMGLQRIQKDLCRLYAESRAAIGGPGDLKGLAAAAVEAPAPSSAAAPAPQAPSVAQAVTAAPAFVRRKVGDERDDLVLAVEELYAAKLLTSTGGNVSVRRASHPDEMWITPSSLPKGHLEPEMMVRVSLLDGEAMDEDAAAPSSERLMHARIMAARPDVTAVIHSHGTQAFLLGVTGLPFVPVCTESAFVGELGRVPFIMPGSDELAETAVKILGKGRAVLLLNHGALVAAPSLRRGVDLTKVIERTSEVVLTCAKLGVKPPVLPADLVATLRSLDNAVA